MVTILKKLNESHHDLVKGALSTKGFAKYFYENCKCDQIKAAVDEILK